MQKRSCSAIPGIMALLFFLTCLPGVLSAEPRPAFSHLTLRDGLSNNAVYCIYQDHLGYIWFGTFSGLNCYDGRSIKTYRPEAMRPDSISASIIFDIMEDSKNRLWIGTDGGGLNCYDFSDDSFRSYTAEADNPYAIASQKLFCLEEGPRGRLWIGTADAGLSILTPESGIFRNYSADKTHGLESDVVRDILTDRKGRVWIATQGGGLSVSKSSDEMIFAHYLSNKTVRDIFQDSIGRIWLGLEGEGLLLVRENSGELSFQQRIDGQSIRKIAQDSGGRLWAGTEREGVLVISGDNPPQSLRARKLDEQSINSDFIRDIFVDESGLVWIASRGGGVDRYNPRSEGLSVSLRDHYSVRQILPAKDRSLWIATDGQGLLHRKAGKGEGLEKIPVALGAQHLYALAEDRQGHIWIGSDGNGLHCYRPESGEIRHYRHEPGDPHSLSSNVVWSLLIDSHGTLWVGTEGGGLNRYRPGIDGFVSYRNDPQRSQSLLGNSIRSLFEDSTGTLWVGTWDGGLSRKIRDRDSFINYTRDPRDPDSISDNSISCITETSDGSLWIGTSGGGINVFDPRREHFHSYRAADGLADDMVMGIVPDRLGYLWISTANGLSRFDLITHQFTNFWASDGILSGEFLRNAYARRSDGKLLFATALGLVEFYPGAVPLNTYQPPLRINSYSAFTASKEGGQSEGTDLHEEVNLSESTGVRIQADESFIGFSFVSLDYTNPLKNQYAVKLEGFDRDWHYLGFENRYYYASLPPGDYRFKVMGTNSNGLWSTRTAELPVRVEPAFYQTWYFYLLIVLGAGSLVYLLAYIRIISLNRKHEMMRDFSNYIQDVRENERKVLARDVHDDLGQLLTSLKVHAYWLSHNPAAGKANRKARYDSMLGIINASLEWSSELASRLRPVILDNLSLGEAITWLVKEGLNSGLVDFDYSIEETPKISIERTTAIFRVVQEALTNIIRHAEADRAWLKLWVRDGAMKIIIEDDGRGITAKELSNPKSYGIIGMRERARHLGGQLNIEGGEMGTRLSFWIPLEE